MGLFDILDENTMRAILRAQLERADTRNDGEWIKADDVLDGRMLALTQQELSKRYPTRQKQANGDQIQPIMIPLLERYVAEAANAYNRPVERWLVDEKGDKAEDETKILNDHIEEVGLDETLHGLERHIVNTRAAGLWLGAKRGALTAQVLPPQRIHPVLPTDSRYADPADQSDYQGHVVELERNKDGQIQWVFVTPAAHYYYQSADWSEVSKFQTVENNAFTWPQIDETEDHKGATKDLPLQAVTIWHEAKPSGRLLPAADPLLALLNLEINVQLSVLFDTLRLQGWSQLVVNSAGSGEPPTRMPVGPLFALVIRDDETASSLSHTNDYAGMVNALQSLVKLMAVTQRGSPNDFAIEGTGPQSGFAKLVDSLPKLEARQDRIRRLTRMETGFLWPRVGAVLTYLGKLGKNAQRLRLRVRYPDTGFPETVPERVQREEHEIKHGLTTAARILAQREGITEEEAQKRVDENLKKGKAQVAPVAAPAGQPGEMEEPEEKPSKGRGLIGTLVRRPRKLPLPRAGGAGGKEDMPMEIGKEKPAKKEIT